MAKVFIDSSYMLKLTEHEAAVLRALVAAAYVKPNTDRDADADREAEDAIIGIHDALVNAGVDEALLRFEIAE